MSHLWIQSPPGEWGIVPLASHRVSLRRIFAVCDATTCAAADPVGDVVLLRSDANRREIWHLLADQASHVWINGFPFRGRMRALGDRDEIRLARGQTLFFSTESLARVVPMPPTESPMNCPRCRQCIAEGTPAVRCVQCGLWHHQGELPCWTYTSHCASCGQTTALDAGFIWTPQELEL